MINIEQYFAEALSFQPNKQDKDEMALYNKLKPLNYKYADLFMQWFHNASKSDRADDCKILLTQMNNVMDIMSEYDSIIRQLRREKRLPATIDMTRTDGKRMSADPANPGKFRFYGGFMRIFSELKKLAAANQTFVKEFTEEDLRNISIVESGFGIIVWKTRTFDSTNKFIMQYWGITDPSRLATDDYADPLINSPYCTRVEDHWEHYSKSNSEYSQYWFFKGNSGVKGDLTNPAVLDIFQKTWKTGADNLIAMCGSYNDWCDRDDVDLGGFSYDTDSEELLDIFSSEDFNWNDMGEEMEQLISTRFSFGCFKKYPWEKQESHFSTKTEFETTKANLEDVPETFDQQITLDEKHFDYTGTDATLTVKLPKKIKTLVLDFFLITFKQQVALHGFSGIDVDFLKIISPTAIVDLGDFQSIKSLTFELITFDDAEINIKSQSSSIRPTELSIGSAKRAIGSKHALDLSNLNLSKLKSLKIIKDYNISCQTPIDLSKASMPSLQELICRGCGAVKLGPLPKSMYAVSFNQSYPVNNYELPDHIQNFTLEQSFDGELLLDPSFSYLRGLPLNIDNLSMPNILNSVNSRPVQERLYSKIIIFNRRSEPLNILPTITALTELIVSDYIGQIQDKVPGRYEPKTTNEALQIIQSPKTIYITSLSEPSEGVRTQSIRYFDQKSNAYLIKFFRFNSFSGVNSRLKLTSLPPPGISELPIHDCQSSDRIVLPVGITSICMCDNKYITEIPKISRTVSNIVIEDRFIFKTIRGLENANTGCLTFKNFDDTHGGNIPQIAANPTVKKLNLIDCRVKIDESYTKLTNIQQINLHGIYDCQAYNILANCPVNLETLNIDDISRNGRDPSKEIVDQLLTIGMSKLPQTIKHVKIIPNSQLFKLLAKYTNEKVDGINPIIEIFRGFPRSLSSIQIYRLPEDVENYFEKHRNDPKYFKDGRFLPYGPENNDIVTEHRLIRDYSRMSWMYS